MMMWDIVGVTICTMGELIVGEMVILKNTSIISNSGVVEPDGIIALDTVAYTQEIIHTLRRFFNLHQDEG